LFVFAWNYIYFPIIILLLWILMSF
jgi:hypothetical protein